MSSLLWVEDFEDKQYLTPTANVFGRALNIEDGDIPDEVNGLRDFLRGRQIILATNFAEAAQIIDGRLPDIDGVVLDIDLELIGEDYENDYPWVEGLLIRWHQYDPNADDAETSYDEARSRMKMIAGYHLYVDLVVSRGFPRHRILFCSQHGDQLDKALAGSFDLARMERPVVWKKSDPRVGDWVSSVRSDPYTKLRRWIILACREMLGRLRNEQTKFVLPRLPGVGEGQLTDVDAENLLETLQLLIPAYTGSDQEREIVYRIFVRTLTQDWDKVDYKDRDLRIPRKAFAAVLKSARNWTSHNSKALTKLTEADIAFLFLIALHACFEINDQQQNDFESPLMSLIGEEKELDMVQIKQDYMVTYNGITVRWQKLPEEQRGYTDTKTNQFKESKTFSDRINDLEKANKLTPGEHEQGLRQIFWHQLHWQNPDFSPKKRFFSSSSFLSHLTSSLYRPGFR